MKQGDLIAAGLSLGVIALVASTRRSLSDADLLTHGPQAAPGERAKEGDEITVPASAVFPNALPFVPHDGRGQFLYPNEHVDLLVVTVMTATPDALAGIVTSYTWKGPAVGGTTQLKDQEKLGTSLFPRRAVLSVRPQAVTLDAATGLVFDTQRVALPKGERFTEIVTQPTSPTPDRVPLPPTGIFLPPDPLLIGDGSPERAAIEREVQTAFARMNAYYANEWYPKFLGTSRPDIPRTLANVSQYRSFADQASIVRSVLTQLGVTPASSDEDVKRALLQNLTTRSIPGFSRHHWATEIDVVDPTATEWKPGARLSPLVAFLQSEAPRFGFYHPFRESAFPEPNRPHYQSEPWHLSYYPIASQLRERWLTEVNPSSLLERVATALSSAGNVSVASLRRVLPTLDLPSYQRNVAPPPSFTPERVALPNAHSNLIALSQPSQASAFDPRRPVSLSHGEAG